MTMCNSAIIFLYCDNKVSQNSFQHFPRLKYLWDIVATLFQLMLQSWYNKKCPIIGEHTVIIFMTHKVTIATV